MGHEDMERLAQQEALAPRYLRYTASMRSAWRAPDTRSMPTNPPLSLPPPPPRTHMHTHIHIHTHTHIYTHTHMHTHTKQHS